MSGKPKPQTCPQCGGRGTVPFGTEMVGCGKCGGIGTIKNG